MKPKIYIAGKITGLELNVAQSAFDEAESFLKEVAPGWHIVNPMRLPHEHDKSYECYMAECLAELRSCKAVYVLKGWSGSNGVLRELKLASELGLLVLFQTSNSDMFISFELNKQCKKRN